MLLLLVVLDSRAPVAEREAGAVQISLLAGSAAGLPGPAPFGTPPPKPVQPPEPVVPPSQVPNPAPEPPPPPPDAPVPPADTLEPIALHPSPAPGPGADSAATDAAAGAASAQAGAAGCRILDDLQSKLETDAAAHAAIVQVPAQARSVANAMMLWDGRWPDDPSLGSATAREQIRSAVLSTVSKAPDACRRELLHGPRMIVLGRSSDAAVVVFGSGEWRWNDLLAR